MNQDGIWLEFQGIRFLCPDNFILRSSEERLVFSYDGTEETIIIEDEMGKKDPLDSFYMLCADMGGRYYMPVTCGSLRGDCLIDEDVLREYFLYGKNQSVYISITEKKRFITDEFPVISFLNSLSD